MSKVYHLPIDLPFDQFLSIWNNGVRSDIGLTLELYIPPLNLNSTTHQNSVPVTSETDTAVSNSQCVSFSAPVPTGEAVPIINPTSNSRQVIRNTNPSHEPVTVCNAEVLSELVSLNVLLDPVDRACSHSSNVEIPSIDPVTSSGSLPLLVDPVPSEVPLPQMGPPTLSPVSPL